MLTRCHQLSLREPSFRSIWALPGNIADDGDPRRVLLLDQPDFVRCLVTPDCEAGNRLSVLLVAEHAKALPIRFTEKGHVMNFNKTIQQAGATGYILLWLLGIPIPILLLIFLLRGCT
jgi:hypothetical protein